MYMVSCNVMFKEARVEAHMDFSTFKPGQLACIKTLDEPIAVSAGAGSGKTFTLTQRIAWALMEGSASDGGVFLKSIDEVLAITFTEKAAGEIKSRVKSVLKAEGMASEAAKVDGAWISTIHGMCSRILRSHAIELSIDPAFEVLQESQASELLDESIEWALKGANEFVSPEGADALFSEYTARSKRDSYNDLSIESMLRKLVKCASASPLGCDCFEIQPPSRSASDLLRGLRELMEDVREVAAAQKSSNSRDEWLAKADVFLERADKAFLGGALDQSALVELFSVCPKPNASFGSKGYKVMVKEAQATCEVLATEARYLIARPLAQSLLELARSVYEEFVRRKAELHVLDNNDLLIRAADAIEHNESIAQEFADKFKLIMVDEFQDTDQLQLDMIARMAGPNTSRLCTVGDAQQSIYRFRGADLAVYKRRLADVQKINPQGLIELPDNFRSHADVLRFVDAIFGQPQVFGSEFMSLYASRKEPKKEFKGNRRIDVFLTTKPYKGISSEDMRAVEAARIAKRLAELRDAGNSAGDMAVLLGRMTNAGVYAEALRREGFSCVISGGSVFASAPEVHLMLRLAQLIANPKETSALFELLSSEMFALSADDFIELTTYYDERRGIYARRPLDEGFAVLNEALASEVSLSAQLAFAVRIVDDITSKAGRVPTSKIMADVVCDTGWLSRLEARGAEGQSVAGNIMKVVRLAERFEKEGACGPAELVQLLDAHIASVKEPPGALSAKGGDFVNIMTVHASKGLEFPIVVVAEMASSGSGMGKFSCNTIEGCSYVTLQPDRTLSNRGGIWEAKAPEGFSALPDYSNGATPKNIADATDPLEREAALRAYESDQELQERRRLMYVAFTRAKEALIFSCATTRRKEGLTSGADRGVYDDVRSALFGEEDIPEGVSRVDFGGQASARVERIDVDEGVLESWGVRSATKKEQSDSSAEGSVVEEESFHLDKAVNASQPSFDTAAKTFDIPKIRKEAHLQESPWRPLRRGVTSYTALAKGDSEYADGVVDETQFAEPSAFTSGELRSEEDEDDAFWSALGESLSSDADKATDLGTAFHLLARCAVSGQTKPCMPDDDRIESIVHRCGLDAHAQARIREALARWVSSDLAARVSQYANVQPEVPFFVVLGESRAQKETGQEVSSKYPSEICQAQSSDKTQKEPLFLEGAIDLLAYDTYRQGKAMIVDYKTGGNPHESQDALQHKHALQAQCYAYVMLSQGFGSVEVVFVRVERPDPAHPNQPQCVHCEFDAQQMKDLESHILSAYERIS